MAKSNQKSGPRGAYDSRMVWREAGLDFIWIQTKPFPLSQDQGIGKDASLVFVLLFKVILAPIQQPDRTQTSMLAFNSSLNEKYPEVTVWPGGRETLDPSLWVWEGGPWAFVEIMLNTSLALTEINCEQTAWHRAKKINICKRKSNRLLTALGSPGFPSISPGAWLWARLRRQQHFSPS